MQQIQNFGDPFFLVIHEGEALSEIKVRIQKKLQVPDEEFSKVSPYLPWLLFVTVVAFEVILFCLTISLNKNWYYIWFQFTQRFYHFSCLASGSLLFYHLGVQSTFRIQTLYPVVFRCINWNLIVIMFFLFHDILH